MPKMKKYVSFLEWKSDQSNMNQKHITRLENLILKICPELEQAVKWGQGCFLLDGNHVLYIHCEDDYVQLGFYNGSVLKDTDNLLRGKGQYVRHVPISEITDINEKLITPLINQVLK